MIATTEPVDTGSEVTLVDAPFGRISWGAIFAGSVTALAVMLVLSMIGMGVGLSTMNPQTGANPSGAVIGISAVVWWGITSLVAFYVGGLVAGRAAPSEQGVLHGMITWATVTLLSLVLLTSAIGGALSGATGLAQFATNLAPELKNQISAAATDQVQGTRPSPESPATNPQAEQQGREMGEKAVKSGALGLFGAALALILAGIAAALGGHIGRKQYVRSVVTMRQETAKIRL